MKTSELTGAALDWAVAKCEGVDRLFEAYEVGRHHYSTNWSQGGPIIEREGIEFRKATKGMWASYPGKETVWGGTHLIAAMRCYVASKLGDEVDVPKELE